MWFYCLRLSHFFCLLSVDTMIQRKETKARKREREAWKEKQQLFMWLRKCEQKQNTLRNTHIAGSHSHSEIITLIKLPKLIISKENGKNGIYIFNAPALNICSYASCVFFFLLSYTISWYAKKENCSVTYLDLI